MRIAFVLVGRTIPGFNEIVDTISRTFHVQISMATIDLPMTRAYNKERKQYDADKLLFDLLSFAPLNANRTVFLMREDLYAKGLSFVFGVARGARACLISTTRLDPRFYGEKDMEKARELFKERLIKEIIHELGHTMGLPHCENKKCVMVFSNSIEDVDAKEKDFCKYCAKALYMTPAE